MRVRIERLFRVAAGVIFDHSWIFILLSVAIFAGLTTQMSHLRVDTSNESYFHPDDPVLTVYDDFKRQFGTDELVIVTVEAPTVFDLSFLRKLEALHRDLAENVPHLADITSLVNARDTRGEGDSLIVEDLLEHFPKNEEELAALRKRAMSNPLYVNRLVSPDMTMATIILETELTASEAPDDILSGFDDGPADSSCETGVQSSGRTKNEIAEIVVNKVQEIVDTYNSDGFKIRLAGVPVVLKVLKDALVKDMGTFLLLAVLAVGACLLLLFRRLSGVFLPFMVVFFSLFSTLGLMGLSGVAVTSPSMILPSFLLAVGVGAAVHILSLVYRRLDHGKEKRAAVVYALGHSGLAVVVTSVTTAIGLASFATTALAPVASLGIFGAVGVLLSLFFTIVLVPALLAIFPIRQNMGKRQDTTVRIPDRFDRIMDGITELVAGRPRTVVAVTVLVMLVGLGSATQLRFSHDVLKWQPASWECRQATENIDRVMGGSINIEIVVDTGRENGLYDPVILKNLDRLAQELKKYDDGDIRVANASSVADILKEIHQALHENRPEFYQIPENADLIPQEFLLFENSGSDDLEKVVDSAFQKARFTIQVPWKDVFHYVPLLQTIRISFQSAFEGRATVTTTGLLQLFVHTVEAASRSMAQGYVIAAVLITLMMILMVGGLRLGLISMIPNLAPVIFVMGLMYWLRLPLDTYTMMIGTIALGLAVDDTVHFLNSYKRYCSQNMTAKEAVRNTLHTSGRAMLITSLVLTVGFFIFTFASMVNIKRFGFLTGLTLILALLADFLSVPALLMVMNQNNEAKVPASTRNSSIQNQTIEGDLS